MGIDLANGSDKSVVSKLVVAPKSFLEYAEQHSGKNRNEWTAEDEKILCIGYAFILQRIYTSA